MLYTYCPKTLDFKKVSKQTILKLSGILVALALVSFNYIHTQAKAQGYHNAVEEYENIDFESDVIVLEAPGESFSQEELVNELKRLNVRFPHIVLAQAILETGYYESRIFNENHNLFGMKLARARSTTAKGLQYEHAYYDHWKESVIDYALFQNAYMNKLRKESAYLKYLDKNYAEAKNYDKKLLEIIEKEKLEELFLD